MVLVFRTVVTLQNGAQGIWGSGTVLLLDLAEGYVSFPFVEIYWALHLCFVYFDTIYILFQSKVYIKRQYFIQNCDLANFNLAQVSLTEDTINLFH